jgi:hypothetical protein
MPLLLTPGRAQRSAEPGLDLVRKRLGIEGNSQSIFAWKGPHRFRPGVPGWPLPSFGELASRYEVEWGAAVGRESAFERFAHFAIQGCHARDLVAGVEPTGIRQHPDHRRPDLGKLESKLGFRLIPGGSEVCQSQDGQTIGCVSPDLSHQLPLPGDQLSMG